MEIQKIPTLAEKQEFWAEQLPNFKAKYWLPNHFKFVAFDMEQGNFDIKDGLDPSFEDDAVEIWHRVNTGWAMWKKAINFGRKQPQAVPEGFVLVPEDQAKDTDRLNFLLGGEKYIRTVIHRDIQNDEYEKIGEHFQLTEVFWIDGFDYWENTSSDSERGAIDKAMLEAQEPAND